MDSKDGCSLLINRNVEQATPTALTFFNSMVPLAAVLSRRFLLSFTVIGRELRPEFEIHFFIHLKIYLNNTRYYTTVKQDLPKIHC